MGGQSQQQAVDPQIQQITEFISSSLNGGGNPIEIVQELVEQQVEEQVIAQAFMTAGYKEEDVVSLFKQVQEKSQPAGPPSTEEQTEDPQEIARKQAMEAQAQEASAQQDQATAGQQDQMAQQLQAQEGVEIKSGNKFADWMQSQQGIATSQDAISFDINPQPGAYSKLNGDMSTPMLDLQGEFIGRRNIPQFQEGSEVDKEEAKAFYNQTGVVKKKDKFTASPKYINPVAFESSNNFNVGSIAKFLGDANDDLFSKELGSNGEMKGALRDWNTKGAIEEDVKGDYYNYKVKIGTTDPTAYAADNLDLFNASKRVNPEKLRDLKTYTEDINKNSKFNYNTETGDYDGLISSRELSEDIYGEKKNIFGKVTREGSNALNGRNVDYFNNLDDATKEILGDYENDMENGAPEGTTLSIDERGSVGYVDPGVYNPNEYETMMGMNKYGVDTTPPATTMIPTNSNGQPQQGMFPTSQPKVGPRVEGDSFRTWYGKNKSSHLGKSRTEMKDIYNSTEGFKYGGSLKKYQMAGQPSAVLSMQDWSMEDPMTRMGANAPQEYQAYVDSLSAGPLAQPSMMATPVIPQVNAITPPVTPIARPLEYNQPVVERTNKFEGGVDRLMDSKEMTAFGAVSNTAVQGAGIVNDWFRDQNVENAKIDNRKNLTADAIYGTKEDPFLKRGAWDANTGTFGSEGQRTVQTNMGTAKYGKEVGSGTIDVDSTLLAKLIAAGADIEIL